MSGWKDFCLIGDSIAQGYWDEHGIGWFGRMAQKIGAQYPHQYGFHNCAMSGDNIMDIMHRIHTEAAQRKANYLLIAVGQNDLQRFGGADAPTLISPVGSQIYWNDLLTIARKQFEKIMVIEVLPVVESRFPVDGDLGLNLFVHNTDIEKYNLALEQMAKQHEVAYCPTYNAFVGRDELMHDDSHPNGAGHELLADIVYKRLQDAGWLGCK